jgi:hypothetical protein
MSQILFGDDVRFKNGIVFPIQGATGLTYDITPTSGPDGGHDYAIVCTNTGAVTVNLPSDTNGLEDGRSYQIIAGTGATAPNITVDAGAYNINGNSTAVINSARDSITIMFTNATSEWHII